MRTNAANGVAQARAFGLRAGVGQLQDARRHVTSDCVLEQQNLNQIGQFAGLDESGKQVVLFEFLVIFLDEIADDSGNAVTIFGS